MAYVNAACAVRVTIFSPGSKFRPVLDFTLLQAFTLATRSYALLYQYVIGLQTYWLDYMQIGGTNRKFTTTLSKIKWHTPKK